MKPSNSDREQQFLAITNDYKELIAKVCYIYAGAGAPFEDLYQEVLVNLWQGLDSFRGEAKLSTWIYRMAINTCITWHRKNDRHSSANNESLDDMLVEPADNSDTAAMLEQYNQMHRLIAQLGPMDKALVTLWLDERPYDEIAKITGLSSSNVAVKLHRIKEKLSKMAMTMA